MIALDLFVGLMTSGLPDNDAILLTWILLQSYGPRKRKDVHLDFAEIEEYTGLHRNNARASSKNLVATGYLRRNDDGSYRFLKDWETFKPKRGAFIERLDGGLKRFAKAALTHEKFIKTSKPNAIQPNCPDSSKANSIELGSRSEGQFSRIEVGPNSGRLADNVNSGEQATSVQALACGRVPASEELEIGEKKRFETHTENSGVCVSISGSEPIPIEDMPAQAQPAIDEAELTRVGHRAEKLFPMQDFGPKIRGIAGDGPSEYPLAWIDAALSELHAGDVHTWNYLVKGILKRYAQQGGPTRASPSKSAAAEKSKIQDDAFDRVWSDPEFLKACDEIGRRDG